MFGGYDRFSELTLDGLVVAVIINGMNELIRGFDRDGYQRAVTDVVLFPAGRPAAVVGRCERVA